MTYRSPRYARIAAGLALLAITETPEAQEPAPPAVDEDLKKLATEIYVYAYPLVLMDITRAVMTDTSSGDPKKAPVNHFSHPRAFPDASFTDVVSPNADTLYSSAWFDLSQGFIVLSLPDTQGRYYLMPMLDAWTNVFASPGKRTTGTKKGDYALAGPGWTGPLPQGVKEIRSPTHMVWMIGRIQTNGKVDFRWVNKLQDQLKLTPLSARENRRRRRRSPPRRRPAWIPRRHRSNRSHGWTRRPSTRAWRRSCRATRRPPRTHRWSKR